MSDVISEMLADEANAKAAAELEYLRLVKQERPDKARLAVILTLLGIAPDEARQHLSDAKLAKELAAKFLPPEQIQKLQWERDAQNKRLAKESRDLVVKLIDGFPDGVFHVLKAVEEAIEKNLPPIDVGNPLEGRVPRPPEFPAVRAMVESSLTLRDRVRRNDASFQFEKTENENRRRQLQDLHFKYAESDFNIFADDPR